MVVRAVRQCSAYHAQQQSVFIVYIFLDMKKLSRQSTVPCPLMTKEEFFARVDKAKEEIKQGEGIRFSDPVTMTEWLNSL